MNKERILTPSVVISVVLIHAGLVALLWQAHKPPVPEMMNIEFVDLADLGGDGGGDGSPEGEGAPAVPEKTPEPEKPKPKPNPVEPPKPIINQVVTKKQYDDIRQPK